MINTFAIFFSTIVVMFVVIRALRMDRAEPWFSATLVEDEDQKPKDVTSPIQRRPSADPRNVPPRAHNPLH